MERNNRSVSLIIAGCALLIAAFVGLAAVRPASAQCGTQASSCKDCHEVQGKDPVNVDGTGWHQSHAFGDFCYICHGGNTQSTDKDAAHAGMIPPMDDIKVACQQCHPKDLDEKAKVYADQLGITLGASEGSENTGAPAAAASCSTPISEPESNIPEDNSVVILRPARNVDYAAQYNERVLGIRKPDWSRIGLIALAVISVLGGAAFLVLKKGWVTVTFDKAAKPTEEPVEKTKE